MYEREFRTKELGDAELPLLGGGRRRPPHFGPLPSPKDSGEDTI
jgi:hypothetical protein